MNLFTVQAFKKCLTCFYARPALNLVGGIVLAVQMVYAVKINIGQNILKT